MSRPPLDPRWEWADVSTYDNPDQYIKTRCLHIDCTTVRSLSGDTVALLCLTCDAQLEAAWDAACFCAPPHYKCYPCSYQDQVLEGPLT